MQIPAVGLKRINCWNTEFAPPVWYKFHHKTVSPQSGVVGWFFQEALRATWRDLSCWGQVVQWSCSAVLRPGYPMHGKLCPAPKDCLKGLLAMEGASCMIMVFRDLETDQSQKQRRKWGYWKWKRGHVRRERMSSLIRRENRLSSLLHELDPCQCLLVEVSFRSWSLYTGGSECLHLIGV